MKALLTRSGRGAPRLPSSYPITFDFDKLQEWGPKFTNRLVELVPPALLSELVASRPEYIEDAGDFILDSCSNRSAVVATSVHWLASQTVAAFHGSRLTSSEIRSIQDAGLKVLDPRERMERLRAKLSHHPRWNDVEGRLEATIRDLGDKHLAGKRSGQVHATISRNGLVAGFNHYLTHGSEFDQHVAMNLFGGRREIAFLGSHGEPTLVTLAVPGSSALEAANPFSFEMETPNLVREVINVWAYWIAYPQYATDTLKLDCGLIFWNDVPPCWIHSITSCPVEAEIDS